jgi:uncharacterized SAM-binding protein YcdF (DUF218 family)
MLSLDLNKTLPLICLPLGSTLMLLTIALRSRSRILVTTSVLILGALSTPVVADRLLRSLEDQYAYVPSTSCPAADAVFVFGGMLGPRDRTDGSIAWNEAAERFDRALDISRAGKVKLIVFSGGPERYESGPDEGNLLKEEAIRRGIPAEQVIVTGATWNTRSEASHVCRLAHELRWKRVLLVTSAYHMPRAMQLTKACVVERIAIPVAYQTSDPNTSWAERRADHYLPQGQGLLHSELALREYLGIAFHFPYLLSDKKID